MLLSGGIAFFMVPKASVLHANGVANIGSVDAGGRALAASPSRIRARAVGAVMIRAATAPPRSARR